MMTCIPVSSLTRSKLAQLKTSACRPPLYISLEGNNYDQQQKATVYEVEIGVLNGTEVSIRRKQARFSCLETLDQHIRPGLSSSKHLMPFPPKKFWGNLSREFVDERSSLLQKYFQGLSRISELTNQTYLLEFFDIEFLLN